MINKTKVLLQRRDELCPYGRLAQLVRAPALHAGGRRFESCTAHHFLPNLSVTIVDPDV